MSKHTWNHRVLLHIVSDIKSDNFLAIHEVHYDDDEVTGWTENPVTVIGESRQELAATLLYMTKCLELPVLMIQHDSDDTDISHVELSFDNAMSYLEPCGD